MNIYVNSVLDILRHLVNRNSFCVNTVFIRTFRIRGFWSSEHMTAILFQFRQYQCHVACSPLILWILTSVSSIFYLWWKLLLKERTLI